MYRRIKGKRGWIIDLEGERVGRWSVLSIAGKNARNKILWNCRCDCGTERVVESKSLVAGVSKSCGCYVSPRTLPSESGFKRVYAKYGKMADLRGIDFALTEEQFRGLTQAACFYCGAFPANVAAHGKHEDSRRHSKFVYNGIDRVDSDGGYTLSNVVPCCKWCNYAKRERSLTEFRDWANRIAGNVGNWV